VLVILASEIPVYLAQRITSESGPVGRT